MAVTASFAAATYGPTSGPPPGAPAGTTSVVDVSAKARARFSRPLPVWSAVPAGSALRARRPTIAPAVADGSTARMSAAAPATSAAAADVPVMDEYVPEASVVSMPTPGAATNTSAPKFELAHSASDGSVAATPTTPVSPAGYVATDEASLPTAATTAAPFERA